MSSASPSAPIAGPGFRHWGVVTAGGVLVVVGAGLLAVALSDAEAWGFFSGQLSLMSFGWGGVAAAFHALTSAARIHSLRGAAHFLPPLKTLGAGTAAWVAGFGLLALGARRPAPSAPEPSAAAGAALYPPLANYRDFYWSTLGAYGFGVLLAEGVFVLIQQLLASSRPGHVGLSPLTALGISLTGGALVAFAAGFLGAGRAKRLSGPEATIALVYFGLPLPILLTVMGQLPDLQVSLGYRMSEAVYLANLLGDHAAVGYWLVFFFLAVALALGITSGFVATGSGQVDFQSGFERFVARRHVAVFRPRLLLGGFAVLMLGILPPLFLYALFRAAESAVDRTRIRELGKKDPLLAAQALHAAKGKEQSPTAMMTALSVGGVGVGVMALIIVLSVMSGFEADLQKKILGTNAHAMILKYGDPTIPDYADVQAKALKVPGVTGATPFIMNEVMLASGQNVSGVLLKGIDPETIGSVTDLPQDIQPDGSIDNLTHPEKIPERGDSPDDGGPFSFHGKSSQGATKPSLDKEDDLIAAPSGKPAVLPGILVGRELSGMLRVAVGDKLTIVAPLGGGMGPQGPIPTYKAFRVAGVFYTGMFEYDSKFAYIRLSEAQRFFKIKGASGIELKVADVDDARRIGNNVLRVLDGYPYRVRDWGELNRNLFSALRLEKLVMGIILSIIVIVAAGLIVATVIMLVLEKRKEISVLKALGVSDSGIVKIFLAEGLQIGIAGGLLGLFAGLGWCLFIERVGIKLDPEVYYIPALPVKIEPLQTALSVLIAILITYLASIYPALKASRVEPVEGLKAE